MGQKILIVDNDPSASVLLGAGLQHVGFEVILAKEGTSGLTKALTESPSLILLDVDLPVISGFEVCRQLKSVMSTRHIPVLMLSARNGDQDRIRGLEMGAEDYISKPFNPREVILRVQRSLGRLKPKEQIREKLVVGDFVLDPVRHELRLNHKLVEVTAVEFKLLALLMKHRGCVLERSTLLVEVWGYGNSVYTRTVDTHVMRIRNKLGEAGSCIETVRGVGYRIKDDSLPLDSDAVEIEAEEKCLAAA